MNFTANKSFGDENGKWSLSNDRVKSVIKSQCFYNIEMRIFKILLPLSIAVTKMLVTYVDRLAL